MQKGIISYMGRSLKAKKIIRRRKHKREKLFTDKNVKPYRRKAQLPKFSSKNEVSLK